MSTPSIPTAAAAQFAQATVFDVLRNLWRGMWERMRERADYHALMALDDLMLDDIGLSRGDIASVLRGDPTRRMR